MKNRITSLLFLLILFFNLSCNQRHKTQVEQTETRNPNVLFLFADDQRADALGCSGNSYIKTPNIDKLAQTGARFTNSYVMGGHHGAICAPSRAMLMSGKSLFHVYDVLDGVTTMPMYFGSFGYETFGTGKWHNGAKTFETSFQKGDNVFIGGMCDHYQVPCRKLGEDGKLTVPVKKGFSTDLFTDAAIGFLNSYSKGKRENPFFCYVAFTAPHDPRSPRKDYIGMYDPESIPLPGNYKKYHPFAFDILNGSLNNRDESLAPWPRIPEIIRESLADYYALISHMDNRIGDIIETLKKEGLFENTIIVYAADNGLAIGSHGLMGKQNLYEHSTKVPLILSGPGIPEAQTSDALVYLYDIFPTLADLCNLPIPEGIDGKDFAPVVKGGSDSFRKSLFTVFRNSVRAVRTDEWKLIRYPDREYNQLFNLKNDPLEIDNLAEKEGYKPKIDEMMTLLQKWQKEADDTASLTVKTILSKEYEPEKLKQKPDIHQPEYTLKKYFKNVEIETKDSH